MGSSAAYRLSQLHLVVSVFLYPVMLYTIVLHTGLVSLPIANWPNYLLWTIFVSLFSTFAGSVPLLLARAELRSKHKQRPLVTGGATGNWFLVAALVYLVLLSALFSVGTHHLLESYAKKWRLTGSQ